MTMISDLDAAIDQHKAEVGEEPKEIKIFGRVWNLIPFITTVQLNPLLQIQAAAQVLSENANEANYFQAIAFMAQVPEVLASVIREDERDEFEDVVKKKGIPVGVIMLVVEAIFKVYDASPLHFGDTQATQDSSPTHAQPQESTTGSGNSPVAVGQPSNQNYSQSPNGTTNGTPQTPLKVVPPTPGEDLQPYQPQIPPSMATPIE